VQEAAVVNLSLKSELAGVRRDRRQLSLTAIVLTFNEELHIVRCIERLQAVARRIVVIDSFSTDRTVEIARGLGAEVLQHKWKNYADQFQWGVDSANVTTDWVLRLDADEYLEPALVDELHRCLPELPTGVTGINLRRRVIFRDRWIKHGGFYPTILLRIWRNGAGRIEQRWMDEHIVLSHGGAVTLDNDFTDHNLQDITWWTDKHNRYATRQMVDFINLEHPLFPQDRAIAETANRQASFKRFLRNHVFGSAPLYLRGVMYFFLRYVLRLGFLDGRQGFVFHFLQGFWNFILIDAKIDEARTYIRKHGLDAFKRHLAEHHKIEL
jgi:glycosyltransferase involved in cell wall biosynthesis